MGAIPMRAPVTTFDERYSDPAATATGWEETRRVLEEAELFWISTVRADGRPHVTPVVAARAEEAIWFSTGAGEQKFVNLRVNSHVVLTTGCNRWDGGLDVVVGGEAVPPAGEDCRAHRRPFGVGIGYAGERITLRARVEGS
jgi:nitroimidazol reductase NimA-like FMN-containing flavoprotein (pyridoxamine 5'-phosphate oxidase superfamily)